MLFNQLEFILLFAVVVGFLLACRNYRAQKLFLLAASLYFYGYWDWRFLGLLTGLTLVNYFAGLGIARSAGPGGRKAWVVIAVVTSLGVLGFFKYYNFFVGSLSAVLGPLGLHAGTLKVILPVGISFYTFQTLSYAIDVYRGSLKACRDIFDFTLYVSFFPQLVAGPIVRAADFLPQLESPRQMTWEGAFLGFRQFVIGMFKKVFIADHIAHFVDVVFASPGAFDASTCWLAALGYAVQIYCDFSGYSDMAIGCARIIGYDFNRNFNLPYIATSIEDFWRRWHISLSSWLRDYLYIPLGGNRKGPRRTQINLMLTMLLGGLWHGAAWTFVVWGGLHGLALAVNKTIRERRQRKEGGNRLLAAGERRAAISFVGGWALTMLIVLVGWVFFRAGSFGVAGAMLHQMFLLGGGIHWMPPFPLLALGLMVVGHVLQLLGAERWAAADPLRWHTPATLFLMLWLIVAFYPKGFQPFIYFQF